MLGHLRNASNQTTSPIDLINNTLVDWSFQPIPTDVAFIFSNETDSVDPGSDFTYVIRSPSLTIGSLPTVSFAYLIMSLVIDQFGLFGMPVHALNLGRTIGGLLLVAGVAAVAIF